MKSLLVVSVLLCMALSVKCVDLFFEFSLSDDYFEPQDGRLHLVANFKDSTTDEFFRKGFNFSKFEQGSKPSYYAGFRQGLDQISSLTTFWTRSPWLEDDKDLFKTRFILLKDLQITPYDRSPFSVHTKETKTFCPKDQKMRVKQEVELYPCD